MIRENSEISFGPVESGEDRLVKRIVDAIRILAPSDLPPDDPRAICGHCGIVITEVDIHYDKTPAGTLLITFRCKNCRVFQGYQIVPEFWVVPMTVVDGGAGQPGQPGSGDIANILADLRNPQKRS
jgi:hypothetical protein